MNRRWTKTLVACAMAMALAATAFAQEDGGGRKRRGDRRGGRREGRKMDPAKMAKRAGFMAMHVMRVASELPEAKELNMKFAKAMHDLVRGPMEAVREKIKKAHEGGASKEEIKKMIEEARAGGQGEVAAEVLKLQLDYCKALLQIAESNKEAVLKIMAENRKKMMERGRERGDRGDRRGGRERRGGRRGGKAGGKEDVIE